MKEKKEKVKNKKKKRNEKNPVKKPSVSKINNEIFKGNYIPEPRKKPKLNPEEIKELIDEESIFENEKEDDYKLETENDEEFFDDFEKDLNSKTSIYWKLFKKNEKKENIYECLLCFKQIKATGGKVSHLGEHINLVYKDI